MALEQGKKIIGYATIAILAYGAYKVLRNKKPPVKAVVEATKEVVSVPVSVVKKTTRLVKGSPEAKAHMAKMREKSIANRKAHKGHATKKGLSQDQKMVSKESHEKSYQKKKIPIGGD